MLQTIVTASHISVQGEYVRQLVDGRVMVRVGDTYYVGKPVTALDNSGAKHPVLAAS